MNEIMINRITVNLKTKRKTYFCKHPISDLIMCKESRVVRQLLKNCCFYARRIGQEGHLPPTLGAPPAKKNKGPPVR